MRQPAKKRVLSYKKLIAGYEYIYRLKKCSSQSYYSHYGSYTTGNEVKVQAMLSVDHFHQELMNHYARRSVRLTYPACIESHFKNVPYMVLT